MIAPQRSPGADAGARDVKDVSTSAEENRWVDAVNAAADFATLLPQDLPTLDLHGAYRVAAAVEQARMRSGDAPRGWKIGFTNRSIWPRYNVHQPIWGRVWRSTLSLLEGVEADVTLHGLLQPRIEPEVVFALARTPEAGMDEEALRDCIDWVAHGVEIVHTHIRDWRFANAAEPVADGGLHGRLLVGPRHSVANWPMLGADLATMALALRRGSMPVDHGQGAQVLDGPLNALRMGLQALTDQSAGWRVVAGDVVTTGTLTDAWPVSAGQTWHTEPDEARLPGLDLRFVA